MRQYGVNVERRGACQLACHIAIGVAAGTWVTVRGNARFGAGDSLPSGEILLVQPSLCVRLLLEPEQALGAAQRRGVGGAVVVAQCVRCEPRRKPCMPLTM